MNDHEVEAKTNPTGRAEWVSGELFPYESRFIELAGPACTTSTRGRAPCCSCCTATRPGRCSTATWSAGCVTGSAASPSTIRFGLSSAPPGYGFTPAEHAAVVERFVEGLRRDSFTPVVHDWGGPIGLPVAGRHPERVRALVICNTFAWPVDGDRHFEWFSRLMGGPVGRLATRRLNAFVNVIVPAGTRRRLSRSEMTHYRQPFPTPDARTPTHVFPREILTSRTFLAEVEAGLGRLAHLPALIAWGGKDFAARDVERRRLEAAFPHHHSVVFERAGHYVQEDAPAELASEIERWWGDDGP